MFPDRVLRHKLEYNRIYTIRKRKKNDLKMKLTDTFEMALAQGLKIVFIPTHTPIDKKMARILIRMIVPSVIIADTSIVMARVSRLITS